MAKRTNSNKPKPVRIDKFYGINEAVGETEIKLGEWVKGFNLRVTKNYKPQKRPGTHKFIDFEALGNAQGLWQGTISSKNVLISCWNGNVYEYDMDISTETVLVSDLITEGTVTIIGTITDVKTQIFWFNGKVYFKNGTDFKEYDGTTYQDVVPYTPTIAINAPPAGGGTLFEEINLLTGAKTQTFIGDGTSTLYQLAESNLDADLLVITVDGVTKIENTDFTVNRTLGQVTFLVAPINLSSVSITWVKDEGNESLVLNHKYAYKYGVDNGLNLFIFGNENEKNVFRYSAIKKANYFPANSFVEVGSDEFYITGLQSQYKQLVVFKENESKLVTPSVNPNYASNTGLNPYNFGYDDLNDGVGNIASNMVQLIENSPVTLYGYSMWGWSSTTSVENERNAEVISDRLKLSLQGLDLSQAVTFDYQNQKEYWVNIDDIVYIWNYGNDTMYKYSGIQATEFISVGADIYYCSNGSINRISESFVADGEILGDSIPCIVYGGFSDFGIGTYTKVSREQWLSIAADSKTSCEVGFITDVNNDLDALISLVEYNTLDFNNIDFDNFSFLPFSTVQPNRLEQTIIDWTYLQWYLANDTNNETLTVLSLEITAQTQGYSMRR